MSNEEKYESLKSDVVQAYAEYINLVQKSEFHDLPVYKKNIQLSDEYIHTVTTSVLLNDFVRNCLTTK